MNETLISGLIGLIGGPLALKVAEGLLNRGNRSADEMTQIRKELRESVKELQERNDQMQDKLNECHRRESDLSVKVMILESEVARLKRKDDAFG